MRNPKYPYLEALEKYLTESIQRNGEPGAWIEIHVTGEYATKRGVPEPKERKFSEYGKELMRDGSFLGADLHSLFEPEG